MRMAGLTMGILVVLLTACAQVDERQVPTPLTPPSHSVGVHDGPLYRWKVVGGDPCNPQSGCTLAWALAQSGWSPEVQNALLETVRTKRPEEVMLSRGWRGWMTWGYYAAKFHPNTLADWPEGQYEPAHHWFVDSGEVRHHLVQVHKCKNWGGFTSVPDPKTMRRGGIPIMYCNEGGRQ